jgi:hypothetical protein
LASPVSFHSFMSTSYLQQATKHASKPPSQRNTPQPPARDNTPQPPPCHALVLTSLPATPLCLTHTPCACCSTPCLPPPLQAHAAPIPTRPNCPVPAMCPTCPCPPWPAPCRAPCPHQSAWTTSHPAPWQPARQREGQAAGGSQHRPQRSTWQPWLPACCHPLVAAQPSAPPPPATYTLITYSHTPHTLCPTEPGGSKPHHTHPPAPLPPAPKQPQAGTHRAQLLVPWLQGGRRLCTLLSAEKVEGGLQPRPGRARQRCRVSPVLLGAGAAQCCRVQSLCRQCDPQQRNPVLPSTPLLSLLCIAPPPPQPSSCLAAARRASPWVPWAWWGPGQLPAGRAWCPSPCPCQRFWAAARRWAAARAGCTGCHGRTAGHAWPGWGGGRGQWQSSCASPHPREG